MSASYRLILVDEYDWNYVESSKAMVKDKIALNTRVRIEADIPNMIIIDVYKRPPQYVLREFHDAGITYDIAYSQGDGGEVSLELQKIEIDFL